MLTVGLDQPGAPWSTFLLLAPLPAKLIVRSMLRASLSSRPGRGAASTVTHLRAAARLMTVFDRPFQQESQGTASSTPKARRWCCLVEKSDVGVENYSTVVMDRLGLGYAVLKQLNTGIIMVSHTLMGQNEPWERVAGHGPSAAGPAGWTGLSGYPDRDPIAAAGAFMDCGATNRWC